MTRYFEFKYLEDVGAICCNSEERVAGILLRKSYILTMQSSNSISK